MKDLVLFGSGGFSREALQVALDANDSTPTWNVLGFLDDDVNLLGTEIHGYPVLGGADWLKGEEGVHVSVAIGATPAKRRVAQRLEDIGAPFATLIHPRAWIGRRVSIGEGAILCAGVAVTTDIAIGRHVILNLNCTVGHDAVIQDYATLAPSVNVSGAVDVGEGCDLGTGSAIIQGVSIGAWTVLGAGAVLVKDLPANVTAVGAPAKSIKERPDGWHL